MKRGTQSLRRPVILVAVLSLLAVSLTAPSIMAQEFGPRNGSLVIVGGAMQDESIMARFLQLAGGPDSPVVVIPTAGGGERYDAYWPGLSRWKEAGATELTVLHTKDRVVADSEEFVKPIREARGVWFPGGRQWRLADSYLNTLTQREIEALLERGGVVGGSSAGATIQGSYLVRGDTETNTIMMGDHVEGFGFLRGVAIDQHLLKRNRQFDLIEVIKVHPELLGIGLDENTAIVVQGDSFEVIGESYVAIYDNQRHIPSPAYPGLFYFLAPGDRYNIRTREPTRRAMSAQPFELVRSKKWPD